MYIAESPVHMSYHHGDHLVRNHFFGWVDVVLVGEKTQALVGVFDRVELAQALGHLIAEIHQSVREESVFHPGSLVEGAAAPIVAKPSGSAVFWGKAEGGGIGHAVEEEGGLLDGDMNNIRVGGAKLPRLFTLAFVVACEPVWMPGAELGRFQEDVMKAVPEEIVGRA